jgi:hypothetical protein
MECRMVEQSMKPIQKQHSKSAILLLEEAVHLLRQAPLYLLPSYYIGSLPFILGIFYFWGDMSRSADAKEYQAVASLGLALLFIWMKCWQAVFAARVKMQISAQPASPFTLRRILSLAATQTLIHSSAVFFLPLTAVMAIPFGWCYAYYQNVTVETDQDFYKIKDVCKKAWLNAKLWPRQNHIVLSIFFVFGIVVFLNIAIAIFALPHLLKKYFGIESMFTLSGIHMINTTFWVAAFGISYLCLDPVVKTVYVLRCYYGDALKSGEDLKTELKRFIPMRQRAIGGVLVLIVCTGSMSAFAAGQPMISAEALNQSIDEVMQRREFTWRMPRQTLDEEDEGTKGPIASVVAWIIKQLDKGLKTLLGWIDKLIEWLIKLWPSADRPIASSDKDWIASVRVVIIGLLIVLFCSLAYILWRSWVRRRTAQIEVVATALESTPDLEDEDLTADDLPANRWLDLAKELTEKGSLRLAIRALYLAILANLAEHELITIEKYKSNLEYELELQRKAHDKMGLLSAFSKSKEIFERVWYGMYRISRPDLDNYANIQKRIMAFAEI